MRYFFIYHLIHLSSSNPYRLKHLILDNFKSYAGKQIIGPFDDFTCIIGPNGAGKSNMMDAISFVLGVQSRHLRSSHLKELIFKTDEDSGSSRRASVKLVYQVGNNEVLGYHGGQEIEFSRFVSSSGVSNYQLNDKDVTYEEYESLLQSIGVLVKARNFLVFQGDVESVASKTPAELTTAASSIGSIFTFNTFFQTTSMALIAGTFGGLLNIGYGHFARADEKGVPVEFGNFLEGFKSHARSLVLVMIATVIISQLSTLIMPVELREFQLTEEQTQDMELLLMAVEDLSEAVNANVFGTYGYVFLSLFLSIAFMFAPYFASLEGDDAITALRRSVTLSLRHFFRIFLTIALTLLIAIPFLVVTIGFGVLIVLPVLQLVSYDIYAQLTQE